MDTIESCAYDQGQLAFLCSADHVRIGLVLPTAAAACTVEAAACTVETGESCEVYASAAVSARVDEWTCEHLGMGSSVAVVGLSA